MPNSSVSCPVRPLGKYPQQAISSTKKTLGENHLIVAEHQDTLSQIFQDTLLKAKFLANYCIDQPLLESWMLGLSNCIHLANQLCLFLNFYANQGFFTHPLFSLVAGTQGRVTTAYVNYCRPVLPNALYQLSLWE